MNILAIDQSTPRGSVALLQDDRVLAETAWQESRMRNQHLFVELPNLFTAAGFGADQVDCFAVSLGPGSFSGLRIALAAAEGMAAPGCKPVRGVGAGETIAADLLSEYGRDVLTVVGDARRQRLWAARFRRTDGDNVGIDQDYALVTPDALRERIAPGELVVTPDWDRIGTQLETRLRGRSPVVSGPRRPHAATLGRLVFRREQLNAASRTPGRPSSPKLIYLHPPVLITPK